jgi:hypothetical protein
MTEMLQKCYISNRLLCTYMMKLLSSMNLEI